MNLFDHRFTAQSMGEALGIEPKAIHNWATRGLIVGSRESQGKGVPRTYSFFNLMEVAVAISLMDAGMRSPQDAFRAATHFAHVGSSVSGWVGGPPIDPKEMRLPGLPYHHSKGLTLLLVSGETATIKLVAFERKQQSDLDIYFKVTQSFEDPTSFLVVNVTKIFEQITAKIGFDYRVLLDAIYNRPEIKL